MPYHLDFERVEVSTRNATGRAPGWMQPPSNYFKLSRASGLAAERRTGSLADRGTSIKVNYSVAIGHRIHPITAVRPVLAYAQPDNDTQIVARPVDRSVIDHMDVVDRTVDELVRCCDEIDPTLVGQVAADTVTSNNSEPFVRVASMGPPIFIGGT